MIDTSVQNYLLPNNKQSSPSYFNYFLWLLLLVWLSNQWEKLILAKKELFLCKENPFAKIIRKEATNIIILFSFIY